ncbi:YhgE/Pip domain-containing protein [Streptomyces apocyni]|uniref:DUF3533 domain-containing protein n=1 Tax=Streptomyces apocyni TaxID=2654677 RepID=UPI0012EAFE46|nr:DUF3533 domain-containing protein [Streptomyces apocyni]
MHLFLGEIKDAVRPRAALLMLGVLALGVLFIASYAGAFHQQQPKDIALGVVAPEQTRAQTIRQLEQLPGSPLDPRALISEDAAREQLKDREIYGALVIDPNSTTDRLLLASGGGAAVADALTEIVDEAEAAQQRTVETEDVFPMEASDSRGLSAFYLVVGWSVGGYLCAAILAISYGARPANRMRATIRLLALGVFSVALGLLGAVVIGPVLGALPGSVLGLGGLGALVVFAAGATTFALQGLAGIVGIGLTVLVLVVAGNPSAGGPYQYPLLPPFWREIGPALPPGAGTWTARSIAYFGGHAITGPLLVLAAWCVGGALLTLLFSSLRRGREAVEASEVRQ